MQQRSEQSWLTTASLVILAVIAVAAVLTYTRKVMIPFVVALFIVALVSPIEDFQVKRLRLPRVIAAIVTLLVVLFVIAVLSLFAVQAIRTIASTAGEYSSSFAGMAIKLLKPIEYMYKQEEPPPAPPQGDLASKAPVPADDPKSKAPATPNGRGAVRNEPEVLELYPVLKDTTAPPTLEVHPQAVPPTKEPNQSIAPDGRPEGTAEHPRRIDTRQIAKDLTDSAKQVVRDVANHMFTILRNMVGVIFGLISGVLFILIFVVFLLAGRNPYAEHSQIYKAVVHKIRRYLGTKVIISAVVGILIWASLSLIGLELAGVFGVMSFLLNFIPSIGPIIVTLLPIPIAVAQFQSTWLVILVIVVPGVIHNVLGNIVEPKLMGEGLDLHPVTILLALSFWGLVWGIVGMFLAAPITAAIRIVLLQFDTLRPIGNLLAGDFAGAEKTSAKVNEISPQGDSVRVGAE
jgi:AI-2 transport protein TqsA